MRATILIVDDDPGAIKVLSRALRDEGALRFATSGEEALRLALAEPPDVILLDAEMKGMSGLATCAAMKQDSELSRTPVVFVTSHRDEATELAGFDAGAADFITKPINPRLVSARVRAQVQAKRLTDELRQSATTDALTGVANRRRFDEALSQEWLRGRRVHQPLAVLLVDVDHFKAYNDCYGHPAGDDCLRRISASLEAACRRPADLVSRYGGEEFALLLPDTPVAGAAHVAERLVDCVTALGMPHQGSHTARVVTVSVGVGTYVEASSARSGATSQVQSLLGPRRVVEAADQALYLAKRSGRAQARVCSLETNANGGVDSVLSRGAHRTHRVA